MSISYESVITPPSISLTSPLETKVETIFFPLVKKTAGNRTAGSPRFASFAITADVSRVKPNKREIDPGHLYTDHYVSNKANQDYYDHNIKDVTITRKSQARQNTTHVLQHVPNVSGIMSGSKPQIKKGRETGSLRGKSQSGQQSFSSVKIARASKSGITLQADKVNGAVNDLHSPKLTSREPLPRPSVNSKGGTKSKTVKPAEKKTKLYSLPQVDHSTQALLHITENPSREGHTRRLSPRFLLEQVNEESSTKTLRTSMNHSATKPKYLGTKGSSPARERTKSPGKAASPNVSTARKKIDKPRGDSLENGAQEMVLPKVTINEVLQSWNIGPQRTRSTSFAGKDPMEFLRSRERSLSDPKNPPISYEDLRSCRYLRTDKDDQALHGKLCSCNSCEHGEGLKNTPYMNS